MEVIQVKRGDKIVRQREKVKEWYIIQKGTAMLKYDFIESKLGPNTIIGILEQDWFLCDYIACTDVTLLVFPCSSVQELKHFLSAEAKMRRLFLRSALVQRHQLLCIYADLYNRIRHFQHYLEGAYNDFTLLCAKNKLEIRSPFDITQMTPLEITHKAENWEMNNSNSLMKGYLEDYLKLLERDENICIGAIMEASAQMHRVVRGVGEMVAYLQYNKDLMLSDKKRDMFHALFEVELQLKSQRKDTAQVEELIDGLFTLATKLNIYDPELIQRAREEYETQTEAMAPLAETTEEDDLLYILSCAGYDDAQKAELYRMITTYPKVLEAGDKDEKAYQLRKKLNVVFYEIYEKCFFAAMDKGDHVPAVLEMYLNFGYMNPDALGEENTNGLFELSSHMDLCKSNHVYTIYEWLKAIYRGEKEPSKNEFDMDYTAYLNEMNRTGELTKEQVAERKGDITAKVKFEISNMFKVVNRLTNGNITMFCPILSDKDMINVPEKMLVTAAKIEQSLDEIRKVDYSVFYRELTNHGLQNEMRNEMLMLEILPDVILMPNVGSRAMMWQETASVKNDTPARFMLPIFTSADVDEMILEVTGRYRWEICRKIQGVHWNDLRDPSLTSEYSDYLQFYRKNRELSADAREQVKSALMRAKNNYREVFVKDYQNWIKYEAKGGFRLNKYVRRIIFTYCPFSKGIRDELKSNPMFGDVIAKHEGNMRHKHKRLEAVYEKYKQSGGQVTPEMKENLHFYQM